MFTLELTDPNMNEEFTTTLYKEDYIEYLWEKEMGAPFNKLNYHLYKGGRNLYNQLESDWLNNEVDELNLINDEGFKRFMLGRTFE